MSRIITKRKLLKERAVEYDPQHPERMHPSLERKLLDKSHTLGGHPAFPPTTGSQSFEEKIASQRFKDVVNKVKRYSGSETIDHQTLMMALSAFKTVLEIESRHKEELEKLAVKLVKKEFGIKDQIELIPDMSSDIDMSGTKIDEPETEFEAEDVSDLEAAEQELKKRRMVNALIQGASKKGHYMFHLVEDELNRIDPRLVNLYGLIMSIADFQYWMIDDETIRNLIEQTKVGKVTKGVKGDQNDPKKDEEEEESKRPKRYVHAEGKIFPVVVHELIKGVMEIMSTPSLPQDPKVREFVLDKADFVTGENWDLRLGPGIWERFLDAIDENDWEVRHYLYQEVIKMPTTEFNSFMRELLAGTKKGKEKLAKLAGEIKRDIIADKYDQSEYEKKKSEKDKKDFEKKKREEERKRKEDEESKKSQDDFFNSIRDLLNDKNNNN